MKSFSHNYKHIIIFNHKLANIRVEKTADSVTIKNRGKVLYTQAFTEKDANCRQPTTKVSTQVWNYQGWLALSVFDNSSPSKYGGGTNIELILGQICNFERQS